MPRINIDLDFLTHPKTVSIEPLAQLLFIRGLIYSATHLTDGFLPEKAIRQLAFDFEDYDRNHNRELERSGILASTCDTVTENSLVTQLVNARRWHISKGGFNIHDFLKYQMSKADVLEYVEIKRKAGRAGGRASAQAYAQARAKAKSNEDPNQSSTDFHPTTNTNTHTKEEDKTPVRWNEQASEFWKAYPKKTGKGNVERWFKVHKPSDDLFKQMLDKITQMKLSPDWIKDGGKFIPMPYTWLNQKRWEDELPTPPTRKCVL